MLFRPIGKEGQKIFRQKSVLIVGIGALGCGVANHLVRAGVGKVRLIDRDFVEESNLQRQMLFDEEDALHALPKAIAAERKLKKINSSVAIESHVKDVTSETIAPVLEGIDVVVDGTDNFETRFLLNDACYQKGIPFVYGGAVSSRGMSAVFVPGETPCLRCLIEEGTNTGETCDTVGVLGPVVDVVASYQAIETMKCLLGNREKRSRSVVTFDLWENRHYEIRLGQRKRGCPCCDLREFPALRKRMSKEVSLCGRETIQIHGSSGYDLTEWKKRLEGAVRSVTETPFLLRVELKEGERLVLFPDGRTLVQGTDKIERARTLYAKYIGA